jgi:hypothetical protein
MSLRSGRGEAKPLSKSLHEKCASAGECLHLPNISSFVEWLVLNNNKFSGYLPPDWRMRDLMYLDVGHNMFSGPLPMDWDRNMISLRYVFLDHNSFMGTILD